jgi:hypothetical protein
VCCGTRTIDPSTKANSMPESARNWLSTDAGRMLVRTSATVTAASSARPCWRGGHRRIDRGALDQPLELAIVRIKLARRWSRAIAFKEASHRDGGMPRDLAARPRQAAPFALPALDCRPTRCLIESMCCPMPQDQRDRSALHTNRATDRCWR